MEPEERWGHEPGTSPPRPLADLTAVCRRAVTLTCLVCSASRLPGPVLKVLGGAELMGLVKEHGRGVGWSRWLLRRGWRDSKFTAAAANNETLEQLSGAGWRT